MLAESYHSDLVAHVKQAGFRYDSGRLTVHLAREFGFCYGVDRAVDYAYQARSRFPDRTVYLTGEIIHNPHVNDRLRELGVRFLSDDGMSLGQITPDDVVILPASASPSRRSRPSWRKAARWWIRRAARCSTSGRTSSATAKTG